MWVLIVFALIPTGNAEHPLQPLTRAQVVSYTSKEACNADAGKEAKKWVEGLPVEPLLIAGKCVEITGKAAEGI